MRLVSKETEISRLGSQKPYKTQHRVGVLGLKRIHIVLLSVYVWMTIPFELQWVYV